MRDSIDTKPNVACEYRFEGAQLIITTLSVEGLPPCEQDTSIYEVQLLNNGNIKFVNIDDTCRPRVSSTAMEHYPFDE
jgi:hypothetical protein